MRKDSEDLVALPSAVDEAQKEILEFVGKWMEEWKKTQKSVDHSRVDLSEEL